MGIESPAEKEKRMLRLNGEKWNNLSFYFFSIEEVASGFLLEWKKKLMY